MKKAFNPPATPSQLSIPRRWPEWERKTGRNTGAMGPDDGCEHIAPAAIECAAFAKAGDAVAGYRAVFIIAEGVERFVTFLTPLEEQRLRDAIAPRGLISIDAANGPVQPGFLNSFDHPETILIDASRITRLFDGLQQRGDFILFDMVFSNNQSLSLCARDGEFDSQAVIDQSDIFEPFGETPQQKWFREADEGTLISNAMDARRDRHRATLNEFTRHLAAAAPQLYEVQNTKFAFYTRPDDIEDVFVFTEQTDKARITYKESAGEVYGHPVMEEVYFKSPKDAITGADKLRQKMNETVPPSAKPSTPPLSP